MAGRGGITTPRRSRLSSSANRKKCRLKRAALFGCRRRFGSAEGSVVAVGDDGVAVAGRRFAAHRGVVRHGERHIVFVPACGAGRLVFRIFSGRNASVQVGLPSWNERSQGEIGLCRWIVKVGRCSAKKREWRILGDFGMTDEFFSDGRRVFQALAATKTPQWGGRGCR